VSVRVEAGNIDAVCSLQEVRKLTMVIDKAEDGSISVRNQEKLWSVNQD
jgi:hypothetical protein